MGVEPFDLARARVPRHEAEHAVLVDGDQVGAVVDSGVGGADAVGTEEAAPRLQTGGGEDLTDGRRFRGPRGPERPGRRVGHPPTLSRRADADGARALDRRGPGYHVSAGAGLP